MIYRGGDLGGTGVGTARASVSSIFLEVGLVLSDAR